MRGEKKFTKAIIRIRLVLLWLIPIILVIVIAKQSTNLSTNCSAGIINFNQEIYSNNPISSIAEITSVETDGELQTEQFSLVQPLGAGDSKATLVGPVDSPLVTFQGDVTYPNIDVLLEITSDPFFVSISSDEYGRWTWTNYGHPFNSGEHLINVYSFVPASQPGQKEVFVQRYSFFIAGVENQKPAVLNLEEGAVRCAGEQDCLGKYLAADSDSNLYLFDVSLQNNQIQYAAGQEVGIELSFTPLIERQVAETAVSYELYLQESTVEPIVTFNDELLLSKQNTLLKKVQLSSGAVTGDYLLKVVAKVAGDTYVQNIGFRVVGPHYAIAGGGVISEEEFNGALVWNIVFILFIFCGILIVAALEYRRFFIYRPIDEDILQSKGYF